MTPSPTATVSDVSTTAEGSRRRGGVAGWLSMSWRGRLFMAWMLGLGGFYLLLVIALLAANISMVDPGRMFTALASDDIRYAFKLSLISSITTVVMAMIVAVPAGYLLARYRFPGVSLLDSMLDIPIVLPPLVVGVVLLVFFSTPAGLWIRDHAWPVLTVFDIIADAFQAILQYVIGGLGILTHQSWLAYEPIDMGRHDLVQAPWGVVLAQFTVAAAFGVRMVKATFEQIDPRLEAVARTLGASRGSAFFRVTLPAARSGLLAASVVTWARAVGEFGPILIFCGTARQHVEILPTSIYLELATGEIQSALAVSLLMIVMALSTLLLFRKIGGKV
jgi:molybdate transport system permease protein